MKEMKFENALAKLENLVEELEGEEVSLEDSLKKFEEGINLVRFCTKKLEEVEKKIEILVKEEGKIKKKPFSPQEVIPAVSKRESNGFLLSQE